MGEAMILSCPPRSFGDCFAPSYFGPMVQGDEARAKAEALVRNLFSTKGADALNDQAVPELQGRGCLSPAFMSEMLQGLLLQIPDQIKAYSPVQVAPQKQ